MAIAEMFFWWYAQGWRVFISRSRNWFSSLSDFFSMDSRNQRFARSQIPHVHRPPRLTLHWLRLTSSFAIRRLPPDANLWRLLPHFHRSLAFHSSASVRWHHPQHYRSHLMITNIILYAKTLAIIDSLHRITEATL